MRWENGKTYTGTAQAGQFVIKRLNNEKGTQLIEGQLRSDFGATEGEFIRWKGYVNSESNIKRTIAELRAMGWRGTKLGDWTGIGTTKVQFMVKIEPGNDGKRYPVASFVRPVAATSDQGALSREGVDALNAKFGHLLAGDGDLPRANTGPADEDDYPPP